MDLKGGRSEERCQDLSSRKLCVLGKEVTKRIRCQMCYGRRLIITIVMAMVLMIMVMTESGDGDSGGGSSKSDNHCEGGTSDGDMMR